MWGEKSWIIWILKHIFAHWKVFMKTGRAGRSAAPVDTLGLTPEVKLGECVHACYYFFPANSVSP